MAENTNQVIMTGNLTADPEGRDYGSGDNAGRVVEFRIAVNRRPPKGGGDGTADYFTVKAFNGLGRIVEEHMSKGRKVLVIGRMQVDVVDSNKHQGEKVYFHSIIADKVEFLGAPPEGGNANKSQGSSGGNAQAGSALPF